MLNNIRMTTPRDVFKQIKQAKKRGLNLWDKARIILVDVPLHADAVKRILPWGMRLTDPPQGTVFMADYTKTAFTGAYKEAALLIHVKTLVGKGFFCCWMIVDDDTALIYGRELLGYPKKMGSFEFTETENLIQTSVSRRGIKVLAMTARRGSAQNSPAPVFDCKIFNAGGMGQFFMINPVWLNRAREIIHESYNADVSLTVEESQYDPISQFISGKPLHGRFVILDIVEGKYLIPVGIAGFRYFINTFYLRFR